METQPPDPLRGSDLPARWAGRDRFVILDTGFGPGHSFLATWNAWRNDAARCGRLVYIGIEARPPTRAEFQQTLRDTKGDDDCRALAATLLQAWPPPTRNLHNLDFEGGRVRLLLAFGSLREVLSELSLQADAFFLNAVRQGDSPALWAPQILKALGRRAALDASVTCSDASPGLHAALSAAGFEIDRNAQTSGRHPATRARYRPRFRTTATAQSSSLRRAVVVGAGLAGAATAHALADEGWHVTVLDRQPTAAAETSGNAGGLFHGTVHGDDGPHARLLRAAALQAERCLRPLVASGGVPGQIDGLLRLDERPVEALQALIERQSLPADWVVALDAKAASVRAGVRLKSSAWFYPGGGWLAPGALVARWLARETIRFIGSTTVEALRQGGAGWQLMGNGGQVIAEAPVVVLANAADAQRLVLPWRCGWPLQRFRGQVSGWHADRSAVPLALPLAGDGYALPLAEGGLLCGATSHTSFDGDDDARVTASDHEQNFLRLQRLTGLQPPPDPARWLGRVGWRLYSEDRLPLAGPVPQAEASGRRDQSRLWPRVPGLYVCTALGGRGITMAPLLGRLLAAQITGGPLPLERSLVDAVDPARFRVRAARREAPA